VPLLGFFLNLIGEMKMAAVKNLCILLEVRDVDHIPENLREIADAFARGRDINRRCLLEPLDDKTDLGRTKYEIMQTSNGCEVRTVGFF
jgi:hypothetical protein